MSKWPLVPLGEVLREEKQRIGTFDADNLTLLGVSNTAGLHRSGMPRISDMSRYLRVQKNWFAYNPMRINVGSLGWAKSDELTGVISPDYVVFSCTERIEPYLLYLFLKHRSGLGAINAETAGSVRERLYFQSLARIEFPLPPTDEQRRLVEKIEVLAGRIEEAKRLCEQTRHELELLFHLQASHWLASLGDSCPLRTIRELVAVIGGGTPSKSNPFYWNGTVPWVSPKDMKSRVILDATDHITEDAIRHSAAHLLPIGAVLVVVRGMILVHTVPSAVLHTPATINQDMKALISKPEVLPEYLSGALWAWNRRLLDLVEKSTHDTRKLETAKLLTFSIPVPPLAVQRRLIGLWNELDRQRTALSATRKAIYAEVGALMPAILDRAFKGEL